MHSLRRGKEDIAPSNPGLVAPCSYGFVFLLAVVDCQRLFEIVVVVGDVGCQKEDGDTL